MFVLKLLWLNIIKHRTRVFLSILIFASIMIFLFIYYENVEKNKNQLAMLSQSIPVTAKIYNTNGTQEVGLQISHDRFDRLKESNLIDDEFYTIPLRFEITKIAFSREIEIRGAAEAVNQLGYEFLSNVEYIRGFDDGFLSGDMGLVIIEEDYMKGAGIDLGDELEINVLGVVYDRGGYSFQYEKLNSDTVKVIGKYSAETDYSIGAIPNFICSTVWAKRMYSSVDFDYFYGSAEFRVKDPLHLNEFKSEAMQLGFQQINLQAPFSREGIGLVTNDEVFVKSATQITNQLKMVEGFSPIINVLFIFLGFIISYLLLQSRKNEFALMRLLGTSKCKCILATLLENVFSSCSGWLLAGIIYLLLTGLYTSQMHLTALSFFICYIFGGLLANISIYRLSVINALTETD